MDGISAWEEGITVDSDDTMYQGAMVASNDNVLKRPVKLETVTWNVGSNLVFSFNPWKAFLENPLVINRLAHYKMIRGKMRVRFLINGNPFYYGRAIASYLPLGFIDQTYDTDQDFAFIVGASQRIHGYINPTTSQGCDLELPFIWPRNFLDIAKSEWDQMGFVTVTSMNALRHANNASDPLSISVFAYMEDFVLTGVTNITPSTLVPQGSVQKKNKNNKKDEYGIVSGPAHTVANWSGKLSDVPYIGKYARATQMASEAIGNIASLFGYSKPPDIDICRTIQTTAMPAVANISDTVNLLSMDAKKEITIDPRVTGASSMDEMALVPLAMKESFLTRFPWSPVAQSDDHLFNMRITPLQGSKNSQFNANWVSLTPSAWVAMPFQYWTGSMQIRIQVVCSAYHRGRLRIAWDPNYFTGSEFNQAYSQILDISDTTDITFRIGWAQPTNYLETLNTEEPDKYNSWSLGRYTTAYNKTCNGVLEITVLNELTTPQNSTLPVDINVFTSMCEDFEVACPSTTFLSRATQLINGLPPVTQLPSPPITLPNDPDVPPPPPPPNAPSNPLVLKTVPANGVVYGDILQLSSFVSPEWSDTIGVADADKGSQLWGTASNPYVVFTQADSDGLQTVSLEFVNPTAPARTVTITGIGPIKVFEIPAGIGSSIWYDFVVSVKKGPNLIPFQASVGGVGRIIVKRAKVYLPTNVDVSYFEPADCISLGVTPTQFTVVGNQAIPSSVGAQMLCPADWYRGSFLHFISLSNLILGGTGARKTYRTQGDNPTGQSMGAYNTTYPFPIPIGYTPGATSIFVDPSVKITRVYYLRYTTGTFLVNGKGIESGPAIKTFVVPQGNICFKPREEHKELSLEEEFLKLKEKELHPQGEVEEPTIEDEENKPEQMAVDNSMGVPCTSGSPNQVYFGEQISSWRQCLKRYTYAGLVSSGSANAGMRFDLPSLPGPSFLTGGGVTVTKTPLAIPEYIASAYVAQRGSGRFRFTDASNSTSTVGYFNNSITCTRLPTGFVAQTPAVDTPGTLAGSSWAGGATDGINMTRSVAFEVPYYSNHRFVPARSVAASNDLVLRNYARFTIFRQSGFTQTLHVSWAAGEDYSLSHFVGAPRVLWI